MPKISKTLPAMKWSEAFTDLLHRVIKASVIPLACELRESGDTARPLPALAKNIPHS